MTRAEDMRGPRVDPPHAGPHLTYERQPRARGGGGALAVQVAHPRVVRRRHGKALGDRRAERLEVSRSQPRDAVVLSLEAQGGPAGTGHLRRAGAAASVRRKDRDVVGKGEHALAQRLVCRARELCRLLRAQKIDAGDLPDEERSSREQILRIVRAPEVGHQIGDVLRCVSRRRDAADDDLADFDLVSVWMRQVRIDKTGSVAGVDGDRTEQTEGARPGDVVVVDVRLEGVGDEDAESRGRGEVGLDLAIGIDQERDARVGIGDEVARVSKPRVEELLDQQLARTLASVRYGRGCWRTAFDSCWSTSSPGPRSSSCGAITGGIRSSTLLLFASACSSESSGLGLSLSMPSRAARPVPSRSDADAGEAESPRKERAEYEAAGGGCEDERDDLETGADRVAQGQPGLRDAEAEHDDDGYGDRRHERDRHRQEEERGDRNERGDRERAGQDEGALERTAALVDDEAELLFHHGLEEHVRRPGELRRRVPRRWLGKALLLEHVGDLGFGLVRPLRGLLARLLYLCQEDLALTLRAHVFARAHRDDLGDRRRHPGDEHRVLVACRGRHGDHDREDARDPVLRTEDRLANFAEEVGFAAFLAQMRSQPRLAEVVVRLGRPLRHRHEGTSRTSPTWRSSGGRSPRNERKISTS